MNSDTQEDMNWVYYKCKYRNQGVDYFRYNGKNIEAYSERNKRFSKNGVWGIREFANLSEIYDDVIKMSNKEWMMLALL